MRRDETAALGRLRANPMPAPPVCEHPERPQGKPLCAACWAEYRPKFEAWAARNEWQRGIGHA